MSPRRKELPGQLALDGLDAPPVCVQAARPARPRQPRSVGWARCPHGRHARLTGVVYHGNHLVFRDHLIRLAGGSALVCRGSGQRIPDGYPMCEGQDDAS
jgi:hypothetical protein